MRSVSPLRSAALLTLFFCLLGPARSAAQPVSARIDSSASVIDYTGSATMHDWTGTSRNVSGTLVVDPRTPGSSRAVVRAPVASFESGPDRRDRKMQAVTEADRYPTVTLRTTNIRPVRWGRSSGGHAGRWAVTADLTFHGQTHAVETTVDVRVTEDSVHAHAQFPVSLTRFGVERPKLLWVDPIADTIRIDARVSGAIQPPTTATKRLDTTRSAVTGTRRIASTDLRDLPADRYSGTSAGLHAAVRRPEAGTAEWIVAVYGFAEQPIGLSDTPTITLTADGQPVSPLRSTGTSRQLDDGTTVEIVRMFFSPSSFQTLAEALTASATIGPAHFSLPWHTRHDLRLLLDTMPARSSDPVSSRDEN